MLLRHNAKRLIIAQCAHTVGATAVYARGLFVSANVHQQQSGFFWGSYNIFTGRGFVLGLAREGEYDAKRRLTQNNASVHPSGRITIYDSKLLTTQSMQIWYAVVCHIVLQPSVRRTYSYVVQADRRSLQSENAEAAIISVRKQSNTTRNV